MSLWKGIFIAAVAASLFFGFATTSLAAISLTITDLDGNPIIGAVNGQEVLLQWLISAGTGVQNCRITKSEGGGPDLLLTQIEASGVLPETISGSIEETPTEDVLTTYRFRCDPYVVDTEVGGSEPPEVFMSIDGDDERELNNLTGDVGDVIVRWSTTNAASCGLISYERPSTAPGVYTTIAPNSEYSDYETNGRIIFDGSPFARINETTTFFITCANAAGDEVSGEITLTVDRDVPPPPPVTTNIYVPAGDTAIVVANNTYGTAFVEIRYDSDNAQWCERRSYYEDGVTEYSPDDDQWPTDRRTYWLDNAEFIDIRIATSTYFEVECGRDGVNINGTYYPATSATDRVFIEVLPPPEVLSMQDWDRSSTSVPEVLVTVTANPSIAVKDVVTGRALSEVTIVAENADTCELATEDLDGTRYRLNEVTNRDDGTRHYSFVNRSYYARNYTAYDLSTSTRVIAYCYRTYDMRPESTPEEQERGSDTDEVIIEVIESSEVAPPMELYVYGNASFIGARYLWQNRGGLVTLTGFNEMRWFTGDEYYIYNGNSGSSTNSVAFNFSHPYGDGHSSIYNIHLGHFDESDGVSFYRIRVNGNQVGSLVTNKEVSSDRPDFVTYFRDLMASNVEIEHGDEIELICESPGNGEWCRFTSIDFGAGNGGAVVAPAINPPLGIDDVTVPVAWISNNITSCDSKTATRSNGDTYSWSTYQYGQLHVRHIEDELISTTTTFDVTCSRTINSVTETESSEVTVIVPYAEGLEDEVSFQGGDCFNTTTGSFGPAPEGMGPGPDGIICVYLVDLVAGSLSASYPTDINIDNGADGVNNIDGTYVLGAQLSILNDEEGELPANSNIEYLVTLDGSTDAIGPTDYNGTLSALDDAPANEWSTNRDFGSPVMFGSHTIQLLVNLDADINNRYPEADADFTNNIRTTNFNLPVPRPPMDIYVDNNGPNLIRSEEVVTIEWTAHTSYPMDCIVRGPGGINDSFDASEDDPNEYVFSKTTSPLTSTSEFILSCTEPTTNTIFTDSVTVEVVPIAEEI